MRIPSIVARLWHLVPEPRRRPVSQRLHRLLRPARLGTLRRTAPLSDRWGSDRGTPIDRFYIERFLEASRGDIRGDVLEVKSSAYTERYGFGVTRRDVLDIDAANPLATVVTDLTVASAIPSNRFDCFILTQTLQLIYDTRSAVTHAHRILRPGGVLLVTVPTLSRILRGAGLDTDHWRFTAASCRALFGEAFGAEQVQVRTVGNVLSGVAFLMGIAQEELSPAELDVDDPYHPLIVTVRAVKQDA